jgi:hypothetical protein
MESSSESKEEKLGEGIAVGVLEGYAADIFSIRDRVLLDPG